MEGRLPTDIASVLMPLLAVSDTGSITKKPTDLVLRSIEMGLFPCPTFRERTGEEEHKGFVSYVTLEARTVAPIYRTQLFTKAGLAVN